MRDLQYKATFSELSHATTLTVVAHSEVSKMIMDILQESLNGKIINIIPLDTLQEELEEIPHNFF